MSIRTLGHSLALVTLLSGAIVACSKGAGVPVPPNEKEACVQAGNRVSVAAYFLGGGEVAFCNLTEGATCIGHLVSEIPPRTQGLPTARLQATIDVGAAKNKIKPSAAAVFGSNWKAVQNVTDANGKSIDGLKKAMFSGKLKKQDSGCTLLVDRIDSLDAPDGGAGVR